MPICLKSLFAGTALLLSFFAAEAAETIPLTTYLGQSWAITARLHDREETFLFDTGGGLTIITPDAAAEIGCKPWGQITGFRMRGDRVDARRCDDVGFLVNGMKLGVPSAGVFDFSTLLPKDAPPLAGAIGLDAFADKVLTLDFIKQQLVIETPNSLSERIKGAQELPVRFSREAAGLALEAFVPVETPAGRLWMELDCGSDAPLMVGRHAATLLGLDPDKKGGQPVKAALVGGVPLPASAVVGDYIIDGNIGAPAMKNWVVTLDLAKQRLWINEGK